jgi:predicted TIM-barrel fold metal-dependent hydrolase
MIKPQRFDVHAHYMLPDAEPPGTPAQNFISSPMPHWTPELALHFMDGHGIATQILSAPVLLGPAAARAINDYGAEVVRTYPQRFGLLASLPMTEVDASREEIAYAFDTLGADGVIMLTNYAGAYLGSRIFDGLFAELDRRGATVFIHPTMPAGYECVACGRPGPVIEFPFDTCRSVADMLYAGVLERYSNLNIILSHAGGALPTLAPRLSSIGTVHYVPHPPQLTPHAVLQQLSRLYFDTAIAGTAASLAPVLELTSVDHIVFGTDFPPATEPIIDQNMAALAALRCVTEVERQAIYVNGRRLFKRFGTIDRPEK